jgi:hypothetical protein
LAKLELAIESRAGPSVNQDSDEDMEGPSGVHKKEAHVRATYRLNDSCDNYDSNAAAHRINNHTLLSQIVDTKGKAVDSTFTTRDADIQPNYAIGVFKDNQLVLTPLKTF